MALHSHPPFPGGPSEPVPKRHGRHAVGIRTMSPEDRPFALQSRGMVAQQFIIQRILDLPHAGKPVRLHGGPTPVERRPLRVFNGERYRASDLVRHGVIQGHAPALAGGQAYGFASPGSGDPKRLSVLAPVRHLQAQAIVLRQVALRAGPAPAEADDFDLVVAAEAKPDAAELPRLAEPAPQRRPTRVLLGCGVALASEVEPPDVAAGRLAAENAEGHGDLNRPCIRSPMRCDARSARPGPVRILAGDAELVGHGPDRIGHDLVVMLCARGGIEEQLDAIIGPHRAVALIDRRLEIGHARLGAASAEVHMLRVDEKERLGLLRDADRVDRRETRQSGRTFPARLVKPAIQEGRLGGHGNDKRRQSGDVRVLGSEAQFHVLDGNGIVVARHGADMVVEDQGVSAGLEQAGHVELEVVRGRPTDQAIAGMVDVVVGAVAVREGKRPIERDQLARLRPAAHAAAPRPIGDAVAANRLAVQAHAQGATVVADRFRSPDVSLEEQISRFARRGTRRIKGQRQLFLRRNGLDIFDSLRRRPRRRCGSHGKSRREYQRRSCYAM